MRKVRNAQPTAACSLVVTIIALLFPSASPMLRLLVRRQRSEKPPSRSGTGTWSSCVPSGSVHRPSVVIQEESMRHITTAPVRSGRSNRFSHLCAFLISFILASSLFAGEGTVRKHPNAVKNEYIVVL